MNTTETSIVAKITNEIESATDAAQRSVLIADLYTFLGNVEKRLTLEVQTFGSKLKTGAEAALGVVEKEGEKVLQAVERHL